MTVELKFITTLVLNIQYLRNGTLCRWVNGCRRFEGSQCLSSSGSSSPGRVLLDFHINAYDSSKSRELFTQLNGVKSQETWNYVSVILYQSLGFGWFLKPAGCMSWTWIVHVDRIITTGSPRYMYLIQQLLLNVQCYPGVSFYYRTSWTKNLKETDQLACLGKQGTAILNGTLKSGFKLVSCIRAAYAEISDCRFRSRQ
jgi:hypothetical protein